MRREVDRKAILARAGRQRIAWLIKEMLQEVHVCLRHDPEHLRIFTLQALEFVTGQQYVTKREHKWAKLKTQDCLLCRALGQLIIDLGGAATDDLAALRNVRATRRAAALPVGAIKDIVRDPAKC